MGLGQLSDLLVASAERFPRKPAAVHGDRALTYAELAAAAGAVGAGLRSGLDAQSGDRVAIAAATSIEYLVAYWGLQWAGCVPVPVNLRLPPDGVRHTVDHTACRAAFVDADLPSDVASGIESSGVPAVVLGGPRWRDLTSAAPIAPVERRPEDVAIIMHTSGTTGVPKGAMMTQATSLFNIRMAVLSWGWRHEDSHLLVIPLFHCTAAYSAMPSSVYLGSTLVLCPRPDPSEILRLIESHRVTTFLGVPSLFHLVVSRKDIGERDLRSLRMIGYSGSPMPRQTIERLRRALPGVALHNFFGLTETTSNTHVTADADAAERPDTIGKPLPEVFQRVVDDDGSPVAPGVVGELCFARENVIPGYWGQPGLLEESTVDGWFHTGDLAMVDEDGYTYIRGRKKEMIIVAGENVYALEVERALLQHGEILEVAVVGIPATGPASYMGEMIKAVIVPEGGADLTVEEVRRFAMQRLASYQVPHVIEFREELPRTPSGKVIKRDLVG